MEHVVANFFSDKELVSEINRHAKFKHLEREEVLINPGAEILFIPLVLKGSIRIIRQDEDGKENFLYHLYPRQTCAMSLTCCQSGRRSMVKAIAEDEVDVLLVPINKTEDWFRFPEWKTFISSTYQQRFEELIQVIDLIAFSNMDKQLLHYLEERSRALNTKILEITQQQIAEELHTHREAIGRLLRSMEQKGLVRLGRNSIELQEKRH